MGRFALHVLYDLLNRQEDVLCERAFAPWPDMEAEMQRQGVPLWSLESRHHARDFDVIAFSVERELGFTTLVNMLDLAGLPVLAAQRGGELPLVIAGGCALLNPEPLADFVDAFALGDGEQLMPEVVDMLRHCKGAGASKADLLRTLDHIPGMYIPSLYGVKYGRDGTVAEVTPRAEEASGQVAVSRLAALPPTTTRPIVSLMEKVEERGAIEIQRGFLPDCGFGAMRLVNRPRLERPAAEVIGAAPQLLANAGYQELSLVAVRATQHSQIGELVAGLRCVLPEDITVTLVGLEAKPQAVELADRLAGARRRWLSLAPLVGTDGLRQALGEEVGEEDVLRAVELAFAKGWVGLRLHFLLGLPGEREEDVRAIAALAGRARQIGLRYHGGRAQLRAVVSNFVPRPHTPFQWAPQAGAEELEEKGVALRRALRRTGVEVHLETPQVSVLEGILARGDRRLAEAIRRVWELGARLDGWRQHFAWERWEQAFRECGRETSLYLRGRPLDESLPWAHIDWRFAEEELRGAWQRWQAGVMGQT
jgi:radical SAM family uncharacterized protein